ncbi:hypothetical protein B7494_g6057 [Chlorociboria aeruginascens]|nr:hypothetical protein B7494_g6057 [Chlorociboria aeruginascens]
MKVPDDLPGHQGELIKGWVTIQTSDDQKNNQDDGQDKDQKEKKKKLLEYGLVREGNSSTCYALASPGDLLTVRFAFTSLIAAEMFVDCVVDGVLRASVYSAKAVKSQRNAFSRVCVRERVNGQWGRKLGMKTGQMVVQNRDTKGDYKVCAQKAPSQVSSIEIQVFRRQPKAEPTVASDCDAASTSTEDISMGVVGRAPSFHDYGSWSEVNRNINHDGPPPPFEIGFTDRQPLGQAAKNRVTKIYGRDYKLWASFKFLLRSTADLRSLGFEDVPLRYSSPAVLADTATSCRPSSSTDGLNDDALLDALFIDNAKPKAEQENEQHTIKSEMIPETRQSTVSSVLHGLLNRSSMAEDDSTMGEPMQAEKGNSHKLTDAPINAPEAENNSEGQYRDHNSSESIVSGYGKSQKSPEELFMENHEVSAGSLKDNIPTHICNPATPPRNGSSPTHQEWHAQISQQSSFSGQPARTLESRWSSPGKHPQIPSNASTGHMSSLLSLSPPGSLNSPHSGQATPQKYCFPSLSEASNYHSFPLSTHGLLAITNLVRPDNHMAIETEVSDLHKDTNPDSIPQGLTYAQPPSSALLRSPVISWNTPERERYAESSTSMRNLADNSTGQTSILGNTKWQALQEAAYPKRNVRSTQSPSIEIPLSSQQQAKTGLQHSTIPQQVGNVWQSRSLQSTPVTQIVEEQMGEPTVGQSMSLDKIINQNQLLSESPTPIRNGGSFRLSKNGFELSNRKRKAKYISESHTSDTTHHWTTLPPPVLRDMVGRERDDLAAAKARFEAAEKENHQLRIQDLTQKAEKLERESAELRVLGVLKFSLTRSNNPSRQSLEFGSARIKRNKKTSQVKFKVRCRKLLYTLVLKDSEKVEKLKQSLPPNLVINDTPKKNAKGKREA